MTALADPVKFNSSTGSDTAASGSGPATAVSGSASAHTGGSASTTITLTNTPDLSAVVAGDLLWLNTSSGRQYSVIASVNDGADTVTVDDSFTIALASAVDYAIGGKRATIDHADSRTLFADAKAGWIIELETDQTLTTSAIAPTASGSSSGRITVRGDSATTRRVINQEANASHFNQTASTWDYWTFENMKFTASGTPTSAVFTVRQTSLTPIKFVNCIFGDATNDIYAACQRGGGSMTADFINCEIVECTSQATMAGNSADVYRLFGCYIHHNASGLDLGYLSVVDGCIISDNASYGIEIHTGSSTCAITNCTIANNGSHGVHLQSAVLGLIVKNNNITGNGGYGINCVAAQDPSTTFADFNNYGNGADTYGGSNTSGAMSNLTGGPNDLAVDPGYTNAAGGDFSVSTSVKAFGWPDADAVIGISSATHSYVDIGAAQRAEPAGGGGGLLAHAGMTGGMNG